MCQFLSHEQAGLSDSGEDGVANIIGQRGVRGVVLEITDLFFKLEALVLDELKYIRTEISTALHWHLRLRSFMIPALDPDPESDFQLFVAF